MRHLTTAMTLCLAVLLVTGCGQREDEPVDNVATEGAATMDTGLATEPEPQPLQAMAMIQPIGNSNVQGQVTFREAAAGGGVEVSVQLSGLTPGEHGIHLHENGDCGDSGKAAGAHWNPQSAKHGMVDAPPAHMGDLGNVTADANGSATMTKTVSSWSLAGDGMGTTDTTGTDYTPGGMAGGTSPGSMGAMDSSIIGKSFVVHAKADDMKTDPSGNSGDRIACGVVQMGGGMETETTMGGGGTSYTP